MLQRTQSLILEIAPIAAMVLLGGCLDTSPIVEGNRPPVDGGADTGGSVTVTDPPITEAPNCGKCAAGLAASRVSVAVCRTDNLTAASSQELLNKVVERCCVKECATECESFCQGGAASEACTSCSFAACKTAVEACKARQ